MIPGFVLTVIGPEVTPGGAIAVTVDWLTIVYFAATPLNHSAVTPAKLLPVIVTTVPGPPDDGEIPAICGA
jgi:hypothetical protein